FDCATKLNATAAIELKKEGFEFVARYLPTSAWKGLTIEEVNSINIAGLKLVSIFEKGATKSSYFTKAQGMADAQEAYKLAKSLGQPAGSAIYFAVDYDAQPGDMATILEYVIGLKQLLVDYKIGIYGSYAVMMAVKGQVDYYWQTYAWSRHQVADFIHMHQYENGVTVAGVQLDRDDIKQDPGTWASQQKVEAIHVAAPVHTEAAPVSVPDTYNIASGDTLSGIAAKFGLTVSFIAQLNGIEDPNVIRAGQVLKLKVTAASVQQPVINNAAIVPYPGHLIKRGSRGKDVERIQRAVGVTADGIFGPKTEAAVKAYQSRHGLAVDGIVGPQTWNVMF
ncbi:MAG: glycoside hydrolase domain-containing protein, partial [Heyndrickxia sp.]